MNSKLIVNGTELDLSENIAVPLNLSISDVKEPEKRKRSYSKSIKLEGTSNNMAFFLSAYSLSMDVENSSNVSFDPAIRNPCEFYKNDLLIFKGKLKLNEVIIQDKNYYFDCTLFSDVVDIFTKLKDKKLNELDWSEYNHNLTRSNVVNSWVSGIKLNGVDNRNFGADDYGFQPKSYGYIYPIVDYGFQKPNNSPTTFRTNQLYPFIYVKEALQKILSDALQDENIEVDYTTSFFTNANMQKLIYGYGGGEQLKLNNEQLNDIKVLVEDINYDNNRVANSNGVGCYYYRYESKILNPGITNTGVITQNVNKIQKGTNNSYYIKTNQKGLYKLQVSVSVTVTCATSNSNPNQPSGISVQVYNDKNWNQKTEFFPVSANESKNFVFSVNIDAQAGNLYQINLVTAINTFAQTTINVNYTDIDISLTADANNVLTDNSIVRINSSIPDIKCSEFLKGIMNLFYAYMSDPIYDHLTNKSTIYIDSFINYYENASVYDNWTDKVDYQREITIQSNSLVEGSNYIYKFSDEKDYFNAKYKELTGLNYGEKSIQLSTWASGDVKFELPFNTYVPFKQENTDIIYTKIIDQSIDNNGNTTIKPYKGKGMLTFYNGIRGGDITIMNSNDDDNTKPLAYPFLHHIRYKNNLNFEPLFDLHFSSRNYTFDGLQVIPNQNTFDNYHAKFVNEITSQNSKLLSLYLNLDYKDIHDLDFSKLKMIDGILYRLNAIKDFDSDAYGTTQVELLKYLG
jgi:hypothetical protein